MPSISCSRLSIRTPSKRWLVMLLLLLQVGFVNSEPLWMMAAEVEHHHLFEDSSLSAQFQSTESHQESTHHCDICHGHGTHFAVLPVIDVGDKLVPQPIVKPLLALPYLFLNLNSIYRPPIAFI